MAKPARFGARALRRLAWAAALALCATQAVAELHLHDATVADEFCTACTFAHAELASPSLDVGAPAPVWTPSTPARHAAVAGVARSFDAERCRAPPLHF